MYIYFSDETYDDSVIRCHPWTHSEGNKDEQYCDFKKHPDLITSILTSLKPWAYHSGIQEYYKLITWLNSDQSPFETNDARFSGIHINKQYELCTKKFVCPGGFMMFFRDISLNISPASMIWITQKIASLSYPPLEPSEKIALLTQTALSMLKAEKKDPITGWIGISHFPTCYTQAAGEQFEKFGLEVAFEIGAWGQTEDEALINFGKIIILIHNTMKTIASSQFA